MPPSGRTVPLDARSVVHWALVLYRRRFGRFALVAAVTFGFLGAFQGFASHVFAGARDDPVLLALALTASGFATFGSTFYAGFLDEEVGVDLRGEPSPSLREIAHDLPWSRLIVADLLLTLVVTILQLGLVVPGLLAFTLFSLVGPIINIERHSVGSAFRRSATLVRPHLGLVFGLVTVPIFVEHQVLHGLQVLVLDGSFGSGFVAGAAGGVTVGSVVGLLEVVLTYALLHEGRPGLTVTS